ncbi:MAG: amino acid carrier protein, partial [Bacteroidales bacterium]|nr:amino acid carrier protein [Bacteroidales bacterium]
MQKTIADFLNTINSPMATVMVIVLSAAGIWFTIRTKGVQFTMLGEMCRLLFKGDRGLQGNGEKRVSTLEAFMVSLASRVGTGNLAGVATAIVIGGPGAIFWMWVMALLGSVNTFVECTLAQLFKSRGEESFIGGPAFYITKGLHKRWFAVVFAVAIFAQFGLTNNMVQANTISSAFTEAFSIPPMVMAVLLSLLSLAVIFGGIQRIAKVCSYIVPFMALAYLGIAVWILAVNITSLPAMIGLIFRSAFGFEQAVGGTMGMAILMGFKRGIFSNEAGEGSAP